MRIVNKKQISEQLHYLMTVANRVAALDSSVDYINMMRKYMEELQSLDMVDDYEVYNDGRLRVRFPGQTDDDVIQLPKTINT